MQHLYPQLTSAVVTQQVALPWSNGRGRIPHLHRLRVPRLGSCPAARLDPPRPLAPARPAQNGATGLLLAAQNGHMDVVRLLLDKGASVDAAAQVQKVLICLLSRPDSRYFDSSSSLFPRIHAHICLSTRPIFITPTIPSPWVCCASVDF
jgi:hypothetical protein